MTAALQKMSLHATQSTSVLKEALNKEPIIKSETLLGDNSENSQRATSV